MRKVRVQARTPLESLIGNVECKLPLCNMRCRLLQDARLELQRLTPPQEKAFSFCTPAMKVVNKIAMSRAVRGRA
jgi:hypothetical protein